MAGNLLCSQDAATAAFPTKNKTVEADHEDHLRLVGPSGETRTRGILDPKGYWKLLLILSNPFAPLCSDQDSL